MEKVHLLGVGFIASWKIVKCTHLFYLGYHHHHHPDSWSDHLIVPCPHIHYVGISKKDAGFCLFFGLCINGIIS